MCGVFSTDFAHLTADNFESRLASDELLVHFFNDFLSLTSFSEDVLYNRESGRLEVADGAAERVSRAIRTALIRTKSKLRSGDLSVLTNTSPVENHYTVGCLDRQQGMRWITRERLPFFLQSDCFFEYKLAKLLHQTDVNLCIRTRNRNAPQTPPPHFNEGSIHHSDASLSQSQGSSFHHFFQEEYVGSQAEQKRSLPDLATGVREEEPLRKSHSQTPGDLLDGVGNQVSSDALYAIDDQSLVDEDEKDKRHCTSAEEGAEREEQNEGRVELQEKASAVCWHCRCDGKVGLEEFKEFLRGTPAEHLLELWMDIERLKTTCRERKNRYLGLMRTWHLHNSSPTSLKAGLLSRLGLATSPCWTEERLHAAQSSLTESLFDYWALRFWTSQHAQRVSILEPKAANCCSILLWGGWGSVSLPLHHHVSNSDLSPMPTQPSSRSQRQRPRGRSEMLQALCVEFHSGFYFTRFCEQSGNQRWLNAVYFWADLQHFHQLFYQKGLDPLTVQREAQLLYFTYIFSLAKRSLDVDEEIRREVHHRLWPAFEELFDRVEEHVLNILLEAWTQLLHRDEESFRQVCVQEEMRCINNDEYQELQSLIKESERRKNEVEHCSFNLLLLSATFSEDSSNPSQALGSWACVPPSYRGYRLSFLTDERQELVHFMSFLRDHEASVHLMCWLDVEQYQRSPQKEVVLRQERWQHLASKYLNEEYFFGAGSPATAEQQQQIVRLAGGLERLQSQCLPNAAAQEIQDIVRNHIEETWLPLFLSTPEFTKRQIDKVKLQGANRLSQHVRHRRQTRREAGEAQGMRMSSSKEIRQVLLNPSSCQQFLNFVSLKGDFLENDVRFWLEVQRYKDLCHSHSDEATIQQKISTIISCFINSSMPPALQIDIPPDQAQRILEKRHELGPYIFREAQMSVFSELMTLWPEFQEFSRSVREEQLLSVLDQKRASHRARVRRQRRKEEEEEEEERRTQELELQELSPLEAEAEDQEDRGGKESLRRPSRALLMETRPLLWSYSKYMAALQKEEALLRRQSHLEAPSSTSSGASD